MASPAPIVAASSPVAVAFTPAQAPTAAFSTPSRLRPGVAAGFDASASKDPAGPISSYAWSFGDGQSIDLATPVVSHVFAKPGTYTVALTAASEGCSIAFLFTGQTASCNGGPLSQTTKKVTVAYPGVRLSCPKSARPKGCAFKLQAVARQPKKGKKPKLESAVAKAKVKPRRSRVVSIRPKHHFAAKLASAKAILARETLTIKGKARTRYLKIPVVR